MDYLLKASAVVAIFYLCYKFFLQRDTFFHSNRGFLLLGLITAFSIPLVVIPIYIEYTPTIIPNYGLNGDFTITENIEKKFDIFEYTPIAYFLGLIIFTLRFLFQMTSLCLIIIKNKSEKHGGFKFIKTTNNISPFSFFNWIVYNPKLFKPGELRQIITHEKVHARQHHSIDILFTQLACIVLWFNPFIWLYNKDLKQNLEFIADQNAQSKSECKKSYQHILLKTSMPTHQLALSNNFYNSLIKKRIVMLQKSKSKKRNLFKYALVLPILALFLMSYNTKKVFVEKKTPISKNQIIDNTVNGEVPFTPSDKFFKETEKTAGRSFSSESRDNENNSINIQRSVPNKTKVRSDIEMVLISKSTTDTELKKVASDLRKKGITIKFKNVKRNDEGEITGIKINVSSKKSSANYSVSSDEAIKPIKISIKDNGDNISIDNTNIHKHKGNAFYFKSKDGKHKIHKSGKGNNVFVSDDDDDDDDDEGHEEDVIILKKGNNIKLSDSAKIGVRTNPLKIRIGHNTSGSTNSFFNIASKSLLKSNNLMTVTHSDTLNTKSIGANSIFFYGVNDEIVYFLDGKEISQQQLTELSPNNIESIIVLKGENSNLLYGDKAKHDVVRIKSKKNSLFNLKTKDKNDSKIYISTDSDKDPLHIIDGKKIKKNKFEKLDPENIESISVLKGDSAIEKYGKKGKDGVIEITTKKKK